LKEKLYLIFLGLLVAISLISPPSYLRLGFIELSDFLVLLFSFFLFLDFIQNQDYKNIKLEVLKLWGSLFIILGFSLIIYGFNAFILRWMFYCLVGYLFTNFVTKRSIESLEYFIIPFSIVTILNLSSSIFQLSYVDNTIGWISYFYENPSFLQRGRLSGFQGSGPNVAGGMFSLLAFLNLYFFRELKKMYFIFLTMANLFLVFLTFSRGSYLSIFLALFFYLLYQRKSIKLTFTISSVIVFSVLGILFIGDSKIILKESDRGFLTKIAIENISLQKGLGPGNYVEEIYNDYFLSINPDILEENLNISLNRVELGITPEEYRNSDIEFFIGTSGGGYEILVQSKIITECSEDRITCQHIRVKSILLIDFLSAVFQMDNAVVSDKVFNSDCFNENNSNVLRGEFYCFLEELYKNNLNQLQLENIPKSFFFVPCSDNKFILCQNRELAIGELAVIVEQLSIREDIVSLENYKKYCRECNFRNTQGFIKMKFQRNEGLLPRSLVTFFTSPDSVQWDMVGYPRTTGDTIRFNNNLSYLEIGGHSDGQSFGNTFLDAVIQEVTVSDVDTIQTIEFTKENLGTEYFVFKPNSISPYNANITFENNGLKAYRPNKYWIAIENNYDFRNDFEIILKLSFPEIPWDRQTLISNTSIINNQIQSWKLEIDDGRLFLYWANEEGVFIESNKIGDKSLRSGVLIQKEGTISNTQPPIVDPSFLSQLTTAHNGYLTFSVEFGILISLLFYSVIFFFIYKLLFFEQINNMFALLAALMFLFLNLTNDMIYSPDMVLIFIISCAFSVQSSKSLD
jgi:hypothetical protein